MSRDFSNVGNDLSWLASSTFLPSVIQMSTLPKTFDSSTANNIEPWESLTNINQVRRNLNKNWISKSALTRETDNTFDSSHPRLGSSSFPDNLTFLSSKESCPKDSFLQNMEGKSPNWNFYDNVLPNASRDSTGKSSVSSLNSPLNLKENARSSFLFNDQPGSLNHLFSMNFDNVPGNSSSSASQSSFLQEKMSERFSVPISPMNSLSPSTNSSTPPKLNTDLIALMQELAVITNTEDNGRQLSQNFNMTPFQTPPCTPTKGCVFCKNNSYHSTFYKSHALKDDNGHCTCPVLRTYVCPLCGGTGDFAHTLKYCPRNTVTKGDPIAAGLPPGKVTNWREVATKMASQHRH